MALWGVSSSDVINCGRNTAVGLGVFAGSALTAYGVKKVAAMALNSFTKWKHDDKELYSKSAGAAFGLAAAAVAYKFVPGSRFALISDASASKMLKLAAVQAVVGYVIDHFVNVGIFTATCIGFSGATAARSGYSVFISLGALGAGLGSGFIPK